MIPIFFIYLKYNLPPPAPVFLFIYSGSGDMASYEKSSFFVIQEELSQKINKNYIFHLAQHGMTVHDEDTEKKLSSDKIKHRQD